MTVVALVKVGYAEHVSMSEVDGKGLNGGTDSLDEIKREGVASLHVGVEQTETGIEAECEAGEPALDLSERVEVVEDGVEGIGSTDRRPGGQARATAVVASPVLGDSCAVLGGPPERDPVCPGGEVCLCRASLNLPYLAEAGDMVELLAEGSDAVGGVRSVEVVCGNLALAAQLGLEESTDDREAHRSAGGERLRPS